MKGSGQELRICKIYDGDYPWDVRVQKVMSTLVAQGYEVHLVCRNQGKRPTYEYLDKVHIHRLFPLRSHRLNSAISFPAPLNPLWLHTIRGVVRKIRANIIIVRDLPLTLAAIFIGRIYDLPIIFDMAENYPAMVLDIWKFGRFKASNLIARNPLIVRSVEALSVRGVDKIWAVVEESKSRLLREYPISESKIGIVSNTPRLSDIPTKILDTATPDRDGSLKLVFIGGLESGSLIAP
jgi:Glycosyltransferase Family 4